MAEVNPAEISAILKKQLKDFDSSSSLNEIGSVLPLGMVSQEHMGSRMLSMVSLLSFPIVHKELY